MGSARPLMPVVLVAVLGAGCAQEPEPADRAAPGPQRVRTIVIEGETANDGGTTSVSGSAEIVAKDFAFSPTLLIGPAEQAIVIDLTVQGDGVHTFTLPEQGIDEELAAGSSTRVSAAFPDMGTLVFYCRYHRDRGMLGGLTAT